MRIAETQPSVPSSRRTLNQSPSRLVPRISKRVPGRSAVMAEKVTSGPVRRLMLLTDCTLPVMGGVADGVKVSVGVGGIVVSEGVNVVVGSGVRDGIGVAVNRGVMLTMGARVAVGAITASPPAFPLHPAIKIISTKKRKDMLRITSLHRTKVKHISKAGVPAFPVLAAPWQKVVLLNLLRTALPLRIEGGFWQGCRSDTPTVRWLLTGRKSASVASGVSSHCLRDSMTIHSAIS